VSGAENMNQPAGQDCLREPLGGLAEPGTCVASIAPRACRTAWKYWLIASAGSG